MPYEGSVMLEEEPLTAAQTTGGLANEIVQALGDHLVSANAVGSRVTCNPPARDTDEDWLLYVIGDVDDKLLALGFVGEAKSERYVGNEDGPFLSWRRGDLNLIVTPVGHYYRKFLLATKLAKRFNLTNKSDRIALFQAILYENDVDPS